MDVISLAENKSKLDEIVTPLIAVKQFARNHQIRLKIFYDSDNVQRFKHDLGNIVNDGAYMDSPMNKIYAFVGTDSVDVKNGTTIDASNCYIRWDTLTCSLDPDTPIVIKSAFEAPCKPCIFSLGEKVPTDYYQVSIIKDRAYAERMPELKSIPLFYDAEECIEWLSSLLDGHFSLSGNMDFVPTTYRWEKQRIFKNKKDGRYWYFDFFHKENKIHYEVFGEDGKHLGEAGQEGTLIPGTAKAGRSISKIIHGN